MFEACSQEQPWSQGTPMLFSVYARPPMRSRASSTSTETPFAINSFAAVRPAPPAPITSTSGVAVAARSGVPNVLSSAPAPMPCRSSLRFIKGLLSATP